MLCLFKKGGKKEKKEGGRSSDPSYRGGTASLTHKMIEGKKERKREGGSALSPGERGGEKKKEGRGGKGKR